MAGYINIDEAIKVSRRLQAEKLKVMEAIDVVRTDLRNAVKMGGATPEQTTYVLETYPRVQRTRKGK